MHVSTAAQVQLRGQGAAMAGSPVPVLPVIDLAAFLAGDASDPAAHDACRRVAECLRDTGALVVRDPRVNMEDNARFLDLMEAYFGQSHEAKLQDAHPELSYQVGATPELVEVPRCRVDPECAKTVEAQPAEHRATMPSGPDPKWRFFWRVGARPAAGSTRFAELNAPAVVPKAFPQWTETMDQWGTHMINAVTTVAEMAALGFGLPQASFTELMHLGPHLLAPTGSDLARYNQTGTVFAGFHYDLNLLTIHGKSRFPGLFIWLRDGRRVPVSVPDGCLLLQAGRQLEWLTGGHVKAGLHEVLFTPQTAAAVEEAQRAGRSTWRASSTLFAHVASDQLLRPLGHFADSEHANEYPPTLAGEYVESELSMINLRSETAENQAVRIAM